MYTVTDYPSKAAMRRDVQAGKRVDVYQPGGMFPSKTDGRVCVEGPHYPKPHTWYADVLIKDGAITKVIG